jgi:hypothetical protein
VPASIRTMSGDSMADEDARLEAHTALLKAITEEAETANSSYNLVDLAKAYNLVVSAYPPQS